MKSSTNNIPSIAHLIWTGHKPISLGGMQSIAKVASFGRDIDGNYNGGLEVHLWVDDAVRFKNAYERMRVGNVSQVGDVDVLPRNLNCIVHSIGELGLSGGNGLEIGSDRSKMTEALLMKAELYKGQGRNKPTSGADVIKALVLDQKGGVYFDVRTALGFVEVLEKKSVKNFGSMPSQINHNFLTVMGPYNGNAGGAGYAIARPNTPETMEMLKQLYNRVLNTHKLIEQPLESHYEKQIGVRLRNAQGRYNPLSETFLKEEPLSARDTYSGIIEEFSSLDSQSRKPRIMKASYEYGFSGSGKIGEELLIHTTGWVFTDVNKIYQTEASFQEAQKITEEIFGTGRDNNGSIGAWSKLQPSKRADMDGGVVGMGVGILNKAWDEKRAVAKENRNMMYEDWDSRARERREKAEAESAKTPSASLKGKSSSNLNGGGCCNVM